MNIYYHFAKYLLRAAKVQQKSSKSAAKAQQKGSCCPFAALLLPFYCISAKVHLICIYECILAVFLQKRSKSAAKAQQIRTKAAYAVRTEKFALFSSVRSPYCSRQREAT
ncbi:hypothetical protein M5K25_015408 [Dendrobium thyrsiflorum]|uniref:Uncharacterized protein n=1 Tax=Dendrobium thyrsiflorum TaxID=117978 RepID=A0ABD0UX38_DENTH